MADDPNTTRRSLLAAATILTIFGGSIISRRSMARDQWVIAMAGERELWRAKIVSQRGETITLDRAVPSTASMVVRNESNAR